MKKLLLFLFITFLKQLNAQITFPMPGADWHYEAENWSISGPSNYTNMEIRYTHDTLFMGKTVAILENIPFYKLCALQSGSVLLFTSNDSVFFHTSQTINQWELLYSFGTPVGQGWQFKLQDQNSVDTINVKVDSVKNTLINSVSFKTLFVTYTEINHYQGPGISTPHFYSSVIYERIGDVNYLFNFLPDFYALCDGGQKYDGVLCYSDSTFSLYQPDTSKPCNYTYLGIKSFNDQNSLIVYPNPAMGIINVELKMQNEIQNATVFITDMLGNIIKQLIIYNSELIINVTDLSEGVYNISVSNNECVVNKKLVIIR